MPKKEADVQREGLMNHCRENKISIVGETVKIREKKVDLDCFSTAINCAVENGCDYLAIHKTDTVEMDDQMSIAICEAYIRNSFPFTQRMAGRLWKKFIRQSPC